MPARGVRTWYTGISSEATHQETEMTDQNVETLRNLNEKLSALRVEVASSENDELDPLWHILLQAGLAVRKFAYDRGIEL